MSKKILIVEDNKDLAEVLKMHLMDLSYSVDLAMDGVSGLDMAQSGSYDLIILDLMLPGKGGIDICKELRKSKFYTLILMLTAKSTEVDRILGLEIGADDYVTKPYQLGELLARIKALFRRVDALKNVPDETPQDVSAGNLKINPVSRSVVRRGDQVELTAKEFDLLYFLASNPGKVYNRSQLLNSIWGYNHIGYEHTVNSHMNRLRAKIEQDPSQPEYILTVWGVGYKFRETLAGDT